MDFNLLVMISGGIILNKTNNPIKGISIDTRTLNHGECFIPIKGDKTDGMNYLKEAVFKGASVIFTTNNDIKEILTINKNIGIIKVDDGLETLKSIVKYIRNKYNGQVIAITGSCGKTTLKEMLFSCLSSKYKVFKSYKNFNNIIGVCKNILSLSNEEIAIFELGMNHKNEIKEMVQILKPDIAAITNIKEAHIGNFSSINDILEAKKEIIHKDLKVLFLNQNDKYLRKIKFNNIIYSNINNYKYIVSENNIKIPSLNLEVNAYGKHNIYNIVEVITISKNLNLTNEEIKQGLETYKSYRIKKFNIKNTLIIDDTYNANIASMESAIDYVSSLKYKNKILVLGDMLELGEFSEMYHKKLGTFISKKKINKVYTYGIDSKYISDTCQKVSYHFNDKTLLINTLKEALQPNTVILFKASRNLKLEYIIEELKKYDV